MAKTKTTPPKNQADIDRFVAEMATLECVHAALVAFDLAEGEKPNIGSAELVLRGCIERLYAFAAPTSEATEAAQEVSHA